MKNIIPSIAYICLFSVLMAGCGSISDFNVSVPDSNNFIAGMPNPWTDITEKQASESAGFAFVAPKNAENVYFRLLKEDNLIEMRFNLSGARCTARTKTSKEKEDISGMWYAWSEDRKSKIFNVIGKERAAEDGGNSVYSGIWHDIKKERIYSLSCICYDTSKNHSCNGALPLGISATATTVFANAAK